MTSTSLPLRDGTLDVDALLALHRTIYGSARMEGEGSTGEGGEGDPGGSGGAGSGSGDGGSFTPPASQADLDRIIQDRVRRATSKYGDYDELKAKAEQHDALELELSSDKDKAVASARAEERTAGAVKAVRAEFKAAAKGVLTDAQRDALLEDLDLSKYLTGKGDVDEDRIEKKVAAFAPADDGNGRQTHQSRDLGQGNRQQAKPKPGEQGQAMAEKRFGKRS